MTHFSSSPLLLLTFTMYERLHKYFLLFMEISLSISHYFFISSPPRSSTIYTPKRRFHYLFEFVPLLLRSFLLHTAELNPQHVQNQIAFEQMKINTPFHRINYQFSYRSLGVLVTGSYPLVGRVVMLLADESS